jgi:phosphatidylglycerophosphate synthase
MSEPITLRQHLPNAITIARLAFAAAFFMCLVFYRYPDRNVALANVAVGLFLLGALTDALDGYLARRWGAVSAFGRIMDPFCDKVLVLGAFVYLASPVFVVPEWAEEARLSTTATGIETWMVIVILARELLVTSIRGVVESHGVQFGARTSGKAKMVLQSLTVPVIMALAVNVPPHETPWSRWTCVVLAWLTVVVTVWSGVPYVTGARPLLSEQSDGPA